MKYWVYINEKVEGPFTEDKLVTLQGFTPDTLICSEEAANSGRQEWVKASNVFEFDQVQLPQAGASHNAASALNSDELTSMLLSKLDALTTQLTGMQDKLDNMGTKLDESITTQQKTAEEAAARADALANQVSNIVAARNVDPTKEAAKDAVLAPTLDSDQTQEKPLDMLGPVDLGTADSPSITSADAATNEVSDSEDDALVLSSALNSLQAKKQSEEEKENTFRDLLTPAQAEELAKQGTPAPAEKTSAQQKQEEQKEAVLAEFAAPSSSDESVLDEVIKEKEAEKENTKPSISKRWMAAGAAALAGAATLFTKKSDGKDTTKDADQELTPAAEKPSLDMEQTPQNISALGEAEEPKPSQSEIPAITENSQEAKSEESTEGASPEQITVDLATLPTTDESVMQNVANEPASTPWEEEEKKKKEDTLQELVPETNQEESDSIITEADLQEAFAERAPKEDASVEQLFGLASAEAAVSAAPVVTPGNEPTEPQDLPSLTPETNTSAEGQTLPVSNPNDLTEIELKEGSTYLISDFVPPAVSTNEPQPVVTDGATNTEDKKDDSKKDAAEIQDMVDGQTEQSDSAEDKPSDLSVSQIILENTLKTKRGAALDIKTVPMVPDPASSERLHIEGLDDDLNTQHDMKSADLKPAGKAAKMVVGGIVALLLAGATYAMLGFMGKIPAKFNIFASQDAAVTEQDARLDEILNVPEQPQTELTDTVSQADIPQAILEEAKNYPLANGYTLEQYINTKHPAAEGLITWDISTAVDPDNYSILVKVPPENPQSFKISYRFNYNPVTKTLEPTISDAKNLLDSVSATAQPNETDSVQL